MAYIDISPPPVVSVPYRVPRTHWHPRLKRCTPVTFRKKCCPSRAEALMGDLGGVAGGGGYGQSGGYSSVGSGTAGMGLAMGGGMGTGVVAGDTLTTTIPTPVVSPTIAIPGPVVGTGWPSWVLFLVIGYVLMQQKLRRRT